MEFVRKPFDEAKKELPLSSIPKSVLRKMALHLDKSGSSNWEYLAEELHISPPEIEWTGNTARHHESSSPFIHLFESFLRSKGHSLERLLQALEQIRNAACVSVLTQGYNDGSFDPSLKAMKPDGCKSGTQSMQEKYGQNCKSFGPHCNSSPTVCHSTDRRQHKNSNLHKVNGVQKVPSFNGSFSSGSTYDSTEGIAGDSISYTRLDSDDSNGIHLKLEHAIPMAEAICRMEYALPSLNENQRAETCLVASTGDQRMNNVALDLSRSCRVDSKDKIEQRCYPNGVAIHQEILCGHGCRCNFDQRLCQAPCCTTNGKLHCREQQEICTTRQHPPCSCVAATHHQQPKIENDSKALIPNGTKHQIDGQDLQQQQNHAGEISCCCLNSVSKPSCPHSNALLKTNDTAPMIYLRDPSRHCLSVKRNTHPLSKGDLEEREGQRNPDGTAPFRTVGSSFGVIQQSPFVKDSRFVRVFVTYADDSKEHMKRVMKLCECLKKNKFSVSLDVREQELVAQDRMGWHDKRFKVADYVLVLISPKYYKDVMEPDKDEKQKQKELSLNTLYIHRCMQAEYMDNGCLNKRFIPVLMPHSSRQDIPVWLRNTTVYIWPDQYKNLFFYMTYPAKAISEFVQREQSSKTPTVQQANH